MGRVARVPAGNRTTEAGLLATVIDQLSETRGDLAEARTEIQRLAQSIGVGRHRRVRPPKPLDGCKRSLTKVRDETATRCDRGSDCSWKSELEHVRRPRRASWPRHLEAHQAGTAERAELYWREEFRRQRASARAS